MTSSPAAPPSDATESALHMSRSAERTLMLLDTVVTNGSMTLSDAANAVDVPASTALRHLRGLVHHGYLIRDDLGRFSVGPTSVRIALAAFRSGPYARLTAAARPHLEDLATLTGESAYLAVRDGTIALYVDTVESPRAIRHVGWVGRSVPLEGTAIGAALTSEPRVPGDRPPAEFNTGAVESDVTAVTAPIYGLSSVLGALSVLAPADRLAGDRLDDAATAIVDASVKVSLALSAPSDVGVIS
ncbi:MAG: IclR family transcriptional regulator [Acidimicrobiales bacterium]